MRSEYCEDVRCAVMRHGEIADAEGASAEDATDPGMATLVLSLAGSCDNLALLGGRLAVRNLVARMSALLDNDSAWPFETE
jgi:hypothetical protein